MIFDAKLLFSDDQNLVASGAISSGSSVASTDYVDTGAAGKDGWGGSQTMDVGEGGELIIPITVITAFTGASAGVIAILEMDTVTSFGSPTEVARVTIPALSAIGTKKQIRIPPGSTERYVRMKYTASGGQLTAGAVHAGITMSHTTV